MLCGLRIDHLGSQHGLGGSHHRVTRASKEARGVLHGHLIPPSLCTLGPVYTTVEKSTGHEKNGVSQL